jgi:transposase-like protein
MDNKVKIRCPACKQVFRETANKVRDGVQLNCPNCCKLLTLNRDTDDPFSRRALKLAKEIRTIAQEKIIERAYGPKDTTGGP